MNHILAVKFQKYLTFTETAIKKSYTQNQVSYYDSLKKKKKAHSKLFLLPWCCFTPHPKTLRLGLSHVWRVSQCCHCSSCLVGAVTCPPAPREHQDNHQGWRWEHCGDRRAYKSGCDAGRGRERCPPAWVTCCYWQAGADAGCHISDGGQRVDVLLPYMAVKLFIGPLLYTNPQPRHDLLVCCIWQRGSDKSTPDLKFP